jgi:hypothetical protein
LPFRQCNTPRSGQLPAACVRRMAPGRAFSTYKILAHIAPIGIRQSDFDE